MLDTKGKANQTYRIYCAFMFSGTEADCTKLKAFVIRKSGKQSERAY